MIDKYIELLLKRCLMLKKNTPLFISYNKITEEFVQKVVVYANNMGIKDIYLDGKDSYYIHDILKKSTLKEIEINKIFDCSVWDEYAKKDGAFLMLESEIPHLMEDIDPKKTAKATLIKSETKPIYKKKQLNGELAWCIAAVPNIYWAEDLFPESTKPLEDFWQVLAQICMFDKGNPIKRWDSFLKNQAKVQKKLNKLEITKLYYQNSLGTDLEITLPKNSLWSSASSDKWLVNMPSYEVFTTPDYRYTEGIVYNSKPLIYSGQIIDNFYLKFTKGKVVEAKAEVGNDTLQSLLKSDKLSAFLGEAAIVNYNSPISNTNKLFKTTLIDENAACHLALGSGFTECIKDGNKLSEEELDKLGINSSKNHVDFMIGTKDLTIKADTKKGKITIMKDGNLVI